MLMKLNKIIIILIFFPLSIFSQNDTIIEVVSGKNNKIVSQGKIKIDGERIGTWLELIYHKGLITYINKVNYYLPNKYIEESYNIELKLKSKHYGYINEKNEKIMDGKYYAYGAEDNIIWVATYKDGKINGSYKEYNDKSIVLVETEKKEGKFDGAYKNYFDNGNLRSSGVYKNGNKVGHWSYYWENGSLYSEGEYVYGYYNVYINTDEIIFKDSNDVRIIKKEKINTGNMNILKDEDLCCVYPAKFYLKNGIWKYYDENGVLIREEKWRNGKLE